MLELLIYFAIALSIIGIPSITFYKLGVHTGIERGERRQILKELALSGIIEKMDQSGPRDKAHQRQPDHPTINAGSTHKTR